ncbi:hypothetical protein ACIBL3_44740 [Kribbella sp. NPDC050124]|uniref:hypothetical protein n=1 Tax=Kribbella sp. NPDC050124 TaxID=3364114 RepID=UPI0037966869
MTAYEAALARHVWHHVGGRAEKHYLRYLDRPVITLCDVERLAAGIGLLDDNKFDQEGSQD